MRTGDLIDGRFEVAGFVGSGGMGAVYRALDREGGRDVALKVLLDAALPSDEERFAREAEALSALDHPGIVRYVAHGRSASGTPYLAMEWVEGEDLAVRLRRGPLSVDDTLELGAEVATALAAAHARGVVHRDLKPANLRLEGGHVGRPKILDFGIATLSSEPRVTQTGGIVGTPGYMAPERALGRHADDPRVDVFSLGAILHECLSGRPVFDGAQLAALLAKIVFQGVPRLRQIGVDVPHALDALIARMLAKDGADRPPDCGAVAAQLTAIAAERGNSTRRSIAPDRPTLTRGERRIACVVLARPPGTYAARGGTKLPEVEAAIADIERIGVRAAYLSDGTIAVTTEVVGLAVDQSAAAAHSALTLQQTLPAWTIAVATGRADLGGGRLMGEAIERAEQMIRARAAAPDPSAIDLDDVTAGLLDLRFDVAAGTLGMELRGAAEIAEAARTLLGRPTPFVGREREMLSIEALGAESVDLSVARSVLVTGDAGSGKSRLRHEIVERARARGEVEVWLARGDPMRADAPLGLIAQLVRHAARLGRGDTGDEGRRKLSARAARRVPAADAPRVAEFLGEIAGLPFPEEGRVELSAARLDPRLLGDQMRRAFIDLVVAEAGARPLVIALDDLHWCDRLSAEYVDAALREARDLPLFVLGFARPEARERLPRALVDRLSLDVRLAELPRRACDRLVREILGDRVTPEQAASLAERSAGNPFFLEELMRAAADGRDAGDVGTVSAMIASRIDALDPEDRRRLRAASVFGEVFWSGGVAALLSTAPGLAHLLEGEWIVRRSSVRFQGEEEYAFRHTLVREAAYEMLTPEDRALGHLLAGRWLAGSGEADAAVLAGHFERGGDGEGALGWHVIAAEQALERGDLAAATAHADAAVTLGATGEAMARSALAGAVARHWRGQHAEAETWAARAAAASQRGGARWCTAMEARIWSAGARGDGDRVERLAADVLASAQTLASPAAHAVVLSRAVSWLVNGGRYAAARSTLQAIEPLADRLRDDAGAQAAVAVARVYLVDPDADPTTRAGLLATAVARFEEIGDRRQACLQRTNLAGLLNLTGAYAEAEAVARAAASEAERLGVAFAARAAKCNLGPALGRRGLWAEAEAALRDAIEGSLANADHYTLGVSRVYLAETRLAAGDAEGAEDAAREALATLAPFPPYAAFARAQLAGVLLARGAAGEARALAEEAFAALSALGEIDEGEALVRVVHAEALLQSGAEPEARAALRDARDRLHTRAGRFAEGEARARFLRDVPEHARTLALADRWADPLP